ncbi:MAG: site-2 protease family protein [Candidatus Paceibacterota bacterium]|jgi:regulator of sigma E protease
MNLILFIIVLGVLIFVHELGHFLVAKKSGMRVDEFGLGFPPRVFGKKIGETIYSINWIPFGGFVKIFGENPPDSPEAERLEVSEERSFNKKNRGVQAAVLVAGVSFNVIFAWLLISAGFISGFPAPVGYYQDVVVTNPQLVITQVLADSPASRSGLQAGDAIVAVAASDGLLSDLTPDSVSDFMARHEGKEILIGYKRGSEKSEVKVAPVAGIISDQVAIGVGLDLIGTVKLPFFRALWESAKTTGNLLVEITKGLGKFFYKAFIFQADFSEVAGPVGIIGLVGAAASLGFANLLGFVAFISLNLAVINLLPFPALDGGRLILVVIETVRRRPLNPKIVNYLNGIGFALLLILMLVITYKDVIKLF